MADYTGTQNETTTAADAGVRSQAVSKTGAETTTAADAGVRSQAVSKTGAETTTAADAGRGIKGYFRQEDEAATAIDVIIQEDRSRRRVTEAPAVTDGLAVLVSTAYERETDEVLWAEDSAAGLPDTSWLPKKVYVRHLNKQIHKPGMSPFSAAVAVQYRDWSNSRTSGLLAPTGPTDGNTPVFRSGRTTEFLAEVFAQWTSAPKGILASHMNRGELTVWEDYLGTTRQLTSGQVLQYSMSRDQPWVTWVAHRTGLTAADGAGPGVNDGGILAVDFGSVLVRPMFTGGTASTVDLQAWAREATQPRGSWSPVGTASGVAGDVSFPTGYREVYIEVTGVTGSPTSFNIQMSGTG